MSFTYHFCDGTQDTIDFPRVLISDTIQFATDGTTPIYIFEDSEIIGVTRLELAVFQSPQFYSGSGGTSTLAGGPITPWRRIAATLLDSIAANKSRLASITQLLDVKLSPQFAAKALREQAQALRDADDNSGAFVIIEMVGNQFQFRDRFIKTLQRQGAM